MSVSILITGAALFADAYAKDGQAASTPSLWFMIVVSYALLAYCLKINRRGRARLLARMTSLSMRMAVFVAGQRRSHLANEWQAMIAGIPEEAVVVTPRERGHHVFGFLVAAVRMRLHDVVRPFWAPVDWLLSTDNRSNTVIAAVVGAQCVYIVGDGGLSALVSEVWEPCAILGGALYVLIRWLRRIRGIELARTEPSGE